MQLILLERVEGLGNVGALVNVRAGYGRNYLLPQGKAQEATAANLQIFERRRAQLEAQENTHLENAKAKAATLAGLELTIACSTSDGQSLYGSVGTHDLADLLSEQGHDIERREILLDEHIKSVGKHAFRVRLHPDVIAELSVNVQSENQ